LAVVTSIETPKETAWENTIL